MGRPSDRTRSSVAATSVENWPPRSLNRWPAAAMTFNPIQHEATTSQQREDTAETCHRWSPSKGLTVQEMALSPSAPVDIRRLVTPWQAAGLAAAAAALTFALTVVVIDDRD